MGGNLVYSSFSFRRKSDYIAGFPGGNYYAANTAIQHRYSWHYDTAIKIYTHHIHIHSQIRFGLYLLKILLEIAEFQVGKMSKINRADIYFANLTIRSFYFLVSLNFKVILFTEWNFLFYSLKNRCDYTNIKHESLKLDPITRDKQTLNVWSIVIGILAITTFVI